MQVGKTSELRSDLLSRFRRVLLTLLGAIILAGIAGGRVLTRPALQPLRDLTDAVRTILQTGRFGARVPIRVTGTTGAPVTSAR